MVLELGAGTGKLTRLLVDEFVHVLAIEPDPEMRRRIAVLCAQRTPIGAIAEQVPLADSSVWFAAAAAVIGLLLRPVPLAVAGGLETAEAPASRRSALAQLRHVQRDRSGSSGLLAMVTANAVMVAVMTMTPLHLRDHGRSLEIVGLVMSVHVAGMFARRSSVLSPTAAARSPPRAPPPRCSSRPPCLAPPRQATTTR